MARRCGRTVLKSVNKRYGVSDASKSPGAICNAERGGARRPRRGEARDVPSNRQWNGVAGEGPIRFLGPRCARWRLSEGPR